MADDNATKAGARHSTGDIRRGRAVKQKAREIIADMEELGFPDEQQVGHPADPGPDYTKSADNALKAISETDTEFRCANYIVLFGGRDLEGIGSDRKNADGTRGEFFTKSTRFDSQATAAGRLPIDWEHNTMRGQPIDGVAPGDYFGYVDWKTARADERGLWVERVLDRRKKYVQWIEALIKQGLIGNSSEAHGIAKAANGEIKVYPLVRDTFTVQPMEPRMMTQNVVTALKALGVYNDDDSATPQATGAASPAEPRAKSQSQPNGVKDMEAKDVQEIVAAALKAEREQRENAEKAEAARQAQEEARIKAAVDAERAKAESEKEALKAQYVAAGRLPMGDGKAPHQARFADTRKYDGLSAADLSFMGALLTGKHNGAKGQISPAAAKALSIKIAEGKSEEDAEGRDGLKALGIEPGNVLDAAKANEVNYSTLASYGDDWVGVEYSRRLWPAVRAMTFVLDKLPSIEVPQGMESVIVPLESGDPTFYKVAQVTDENATTLTPNATVASSKLGTSKNTLTLAKGGARTQYSGEMEEDSLIPWAPQLRAQMEKATAENLEHALIDGDTETAATTNINDIGGTPGGSEFFLLVNGFRKSCLVTTTANSRSASGSFADSDFLATVDLMGAAGLVGADVTKVAFILDPSAYRKALQLASVKTRDLFAQATIENGVLNSVWGYPVFRSFFMHYLSTVRKANTAGKVDQDTVGNNTRGAILAVRWDQWLFGWKRRVTMETVRIPRADVTEITALLRFGLLQRDTEGAAISYNVGV